MASEKRQSTLKKLSIYPLTAAIALFASAGLKTYVDIRGNDIIKNNARTLSEEEAISLFEQIKRDYDLSKENIELILDKNSDSRWGRGLTERTEGGYKVTLSAPYSDVIVRHELSHVSDFTNDRFYLRSFSNFFGWAASELRAQNRSITRRE